MRILTRYITLYSVYVELIKIVDAYPGILVAYNSLRKAYSTRLIKPKMDYSYEMSAVRFLITKLFRRF